MLKSTIAPTPEEQATSDFTRRQPRGDASSKLNNSRSVVCIRRAGGPWRDLKA